MFRSLRGLSGDTGGNVLVEFAFAVPILVTLLIGLVDFGAGVHDMLGLRSAARAGAEFAVARPTDLDGVTAVVLASTDLKQDAVTVTTTNFCECPNGAAVACDGTCSGVIREYVRVRVSQPFAPILPYGHLVMPDEIVGEAVVRVR
ncbi:MAG: pilus assembly protein [Alphaproteobacteria bacterium]|nr:pilus assembly protein [Alphaproteobacteria bacterium]